MNYEPEFPWDTERLTEPLFLVSAERSGSTMLRLMLDHHPDIAFEHEFDLAVEMVSEEGDFPAINAYLDWLETVRGFTYTVDASLSYPALVESFLRQKQAASGSKPWIGATMHHHFHRLLYLWPHARFIHLMRDPRDTARSVVDKGWAGNLFVGAARWRDSERCWDLLSQHLRPDQAIDVHYERLAQNPTEELTRICRFIGVDYDPAMLRYTESAPQYPQPDASLANQWRRKASPRQIRQVEAQVGELMQRRGYEPCDPHAKVRLLSQKILSFESRVKCLGHRIRKYGLGLVLRDLLTRRLGLHAWRRQVGRQINEIETNRIRLEAAGVLPPSANIRPARQRHETSARRSS